MRWNVELRSAVGARWVLIHRHAVLPAALAGAQAPKVGTRSGLVPKSSLSWSNARARRTRLKETEQRFAARNTEIHEVTAWIFKATKDLHNSARGKTEARLARAVA